MVFKQTAVCPALTPQLTRVSCESAHRLRHKSVSHPTTSKVTVILLEAAVEGGGDIGVLQDPHTVAESMGTFTISIWTAPLGQSWANRSFRPTGTCLWRRPDFAFLAPTSPPLALKVQAPCWSVALLRCGNACLAVFR